MNQFFRSKLRALANIFFLVGSLFLVTALILSLLPPAVSFAQNAPAIWITSGGCGDETQSQQQFDAGTRIFVNGAGYDPNQEYNWALSAGSNDASQVAGGIVRSEADGTFCFGAYEIRPEDGGEYRVVVGAVETGYSVNSAEAPTPTPMPSPTATDTLQSLPISPISPKSTPFVVASATSSPVVTPTVTAPASATGTTVAAPSTATPSSTPSVASPTSVPPTVINVQPAASPSPVPETPVATGTPIATSSPSATNTLATTSTVTATPTEESQLPVPVQSSWDYACGSGVEVDIIGEGMGSRYRVDGNPRTLKIDPSGLQSILAQLVAKERPDVPMPDGAIISSPDERHEFEEPTSAGTGYYYETMLDPADEVTGEIIGEGTNRYKTPRAFVAYLFRSGGSGDTRTIGKLVHAYVYRSSHTETVAIPAAAAPRDVEVTFVIADIADDDRKAVLIAEAGPVTVQETLTQQNRGDELIIYTLTVPAVPGDVTEMRLTLDSPVDNGDSLYWTGFNMTLPCNGVVPPLPTDTPTMTPTPAASPSPTGTAVPGETATPTPTGTAVPGATMTPTSTPTGTAIPGASPTPTQTSTPVVHPPMQSPTATPSPTATVRATQTPTDDDEEGPPPTATPQPPSPTATAQISPPTQPTPVAPVETPPALLPVTGVDSGPARDDRPLVFLTLGLNLLGLGFVLHRVARKRQHSE